ncbi:MAG: FAD:protein FMN transferase [Spirochaetaceae bacterium]|jgi:thiamine biosynthesis lipoprotein|nr:FAD:protein FMN transferase [Spirochaetaceae bacterium]
MFNRAALAAVLLAAFVFASCAGKTPQGQSEFVLGTLCRLRIAQSGKTGAYRDVFSRLREIDDTFSVNKPDSDIGRINRAAGIEPVHVGDDVITVLSRALFFAEISDGGFDPTIGPLVKLWGIGTDEERIPSSDEIARALSLVNWRDVKIDKGRGTVFLERQGMALDLGGIAKGYAADEAVNILRKHRVKSALIDFGGNIAAYGAKAPAKPFEPPPPWKIGVQNPRKERGEYLGVVEIRDGTLVTSGDYERFFEEDGVRYHHILSTKTGYPVENDIVSVTIIQNLRGYDAQNEYKTASMDADALSTTLFTMGYDDASTFISQFPGIYAIFALKNGEIRAAMRKGFVLDLNVVRE